MGLLDPGIQYANTSQNTQNQTTGSTNQASSNQSTGTSATQNVGTTANQSTSGVGPEFLQQHQQDVLNLARQGAVEGGVAGLSADEQQARELARAQTGNWVPGLSSSLNLAQQAATQGAASGIQNYMNPFQSQVMDNVQRRAQQQFNQNLGGLAGSAISGGGFGGARHSQAIGQSAAQSAADTAGELGKIGLAGWQTALGASQADLDRQLAGARDMSNIAARQQALGSADVDRLAGLGATERGINQQGLDYKLKTAQQLANLGSSVGDPFGKTSSSTGTTTGSQTGTTSNQQTGQNVSNTAGTSDTKSQGTSPFKSTESKLDRLLGGVTAGGNLLNLLAGRGGAGGGGGFGGMGGIVNQGASALRNIFGGGGGGGSYADPYSGGYEGSDYDMSFDDGDVWGSYGDEGWGDWKDGGHIKKFACGGYAEGGMPPAPIAPELKQSLSLVANQQQPQQMAEGGQPFGEENMDPMQALEVLAQAGCPPELLQQCEQAMGQGGMGGGGEMPPAGGGMAMGGLAHMAHGGMMHMNQGGGAYGISPEMIARLKAASSQGQFGGQSANPFAPGHMGAGQAGMSGLSNASPEQQRMEMIRRREASMKGMHASPMAR